MAGFNPLKEKIHSFEEATKILRWDSPYPLIRKAMDGETEDCETHTERRSFGFLFSK